MEVLLINPSGTEFLGSGYTNPPLGLLYLAGEMRRHKIGVRVIDGCVEKIRLENEPDVVGIPCLTPARHRAFELVYRVRKKWPKVKIVMGGAHPSIMAKQILDNYPVDAVCKGEGETWLRKYVLGETDGSEKFHYDNVDDIAFPAWDMIDLERYRYKFKLRADVEFSRGCPAHCNFCSSWHIWPKYRVRSGKNMVEELIYLRKRGIRKFTFIDDAFTIIHDAVVDLCEEILKRPILADIQFAITTRADTVNKELLKLLARAGCSSISYGVESGSPKMITAVHKGMVSYGGKADPKEYIQTCETAIKNTEVAGITAIALMMVGNPGESEETINDSLAFLKRANPGRIGSVGGVWIMPGTALYQKAKRKGMIDDSFWLKRNKLMFWPCPKARKWQRKLYSYNKKIWWRHVLAKPYPRAFTGRLIRKARLAFIGR